MTTPQNDPTTGRLSRRGLIQSAAAAAAASAVPAAALAAEPKNQVTKGRINQSVVNWCFNKHWDLDTLCQNVKALGGKSIELINP
ncbi:MAG: hydroxypyruvate isomerase, partial [Planctomycetota bacterium]